MNRKKTRKTKYLSLFLFSLLAFLLLFSQNVSARQNPNRGGEVVRWLKRLNPRKEKENANNAARQLELQIEGSTLPAGPDPATQEPSTISSSRRRKSKQQRSAAPSPPSLGWVLAPSQVESTLDLGLALSGTFSESNEERKEKVLPPLTPPPIESETNTSKFFKPEKPPITSPITWSLPKNIPQSPASDVPVPRIGRGKTIHFAPSSTNGKKKKEKRWYRGGQRSKSIPLKTPSNYAKNWGPSTPSSLSQASTSSEATLSSEREDSKSRNLDPVIPKSSSVPPTMPDRQNEQAANISLFADDTTLRRRSASPPSSPKALAMSNRDDLPANREEAPRLTYEQKGAGDDIQHPKDPQYLPANRKASPPIKPRNEPKAIEYNNEANKRGKNSPKKEEVEHEKTTSEKAILLLCFVAVAAFVIVEQKLFSRHNKNTPSANTRQTGAHTNLAKKEAQQHQTGAKAQEELRKQPLGKDGGNPDDNTPPEGDEDGRNPGNNKPSKETGGNPDKNAPSEGDGRKASTNNPSGENEGKSGKSKPAREAGAKSDAKSTSRDTNTSSSPVSKIHNKQDQGLSQYKPDTRHNPDEAKIAKPDQRLQLDTKNNHTLILIATLLGLVTILAALFLLKIKRK